jgi:hypothetical protein
MKISGCVSRAGDDETISRIMYLRLYKFAGKCPTSKAETNGWRSSPGPLWVKVNRFAVQAGNCFTVPFGPKLLLSRILAPIL